MKANGAYCIDFHEELLKKTHLFMNYCEMMIKKDVFFVDFIFIKIIFAL